MLRVGCQVLVPVSFHHPDTPAEAAAWIASYAQNVDSGDASFVSFAAAFLSPHWCLSDDTDTGTGVWLEMRRAKRGGATPIAAGTVSCVPVVTVRVRENAARLCVTQGPVEEGPFPSRRFVEIMETDRERLKNES